MKHAWFPGHFIVHVGLSCKDVFIGILCCIISCHLRLTLLQPCVGFFLYNLMSSLSQIEGAEKSQFILCCHVWFGQQCSAQASQDLGGEKISKFKIHNCSKCCLTFFTKKTIPENPQQDKKNLLCLREVDGKRSCLALFLYNVMYFPKTFK